MADMVGPFNGTAPWSEGEWYNVAPAWVPSGIIGSPAASISAGDFAVTSSGLNVTVACNGDRAWIDGSGYKPDTDKTLPVTANANASLSRRDRVVIRRDLAAKTTAVVRLTGTPAATPAAPTLTQTTGGVYDVPICSFLVPPNSGATLSSITDERVWVDPAGGGYMPISVDRTTDVVNLPVNPNSSASPSGAGLTLPPLPVGRIVIVQLSTDFYAEGLGEAQSLQADLVGYTGATRIAGHPHATFSMSFLTVTVTTRQTFRITDPNRSVIFSSVYQSGAGSPRCVLKREDWTAWL